MKARTLLLGDWPGPVRDPIDVLRGVLVVAAVVEAAGGDAKGAGYLGVGALVALAIRPLLLPRPADLAVVLAVALQGFGEALRLYDDVAWFDRSVHVLIPLVVGPVLAIALARLDVVPDPADHTTTRHHAGLWILATALGLSVGALWEVFEYAADGLLGSDLSQGNVDTIGDLLADAVGAILGGGLLTLWTVKSWGSVRRIPGVNTTEAVE